MFSRDNFAIYIKVKKIQKEKKELKLQLSLQVEKKDEQLFSSYKIGPFVKF